MKYKLDFLFSVNGRQIRIVAHMDGLSTPGVNGYRVQIWDGVIVPNQELISRFTINFNGELYSWGDEVNEKYCAENNLAELIISQGQEVKYKYQIIKGTPDPYADNVRNDGEFEQHVTGLLVGFNHKSFEVAEMPFKNMGDDFYTVNLEQISQ